MPNSYIKQLQIGNDNYNIKAEKAANQNSDAAVVRNIQYGTNAPSGGESGQVYLQYNPTSIANNYVYAEDTAANPANVVDVYYSKSEVDNTIASLNSTISSLNSTISTLTSRISSLENATAVHEYLWSGNNGVTRTYSFSGSGYCMVSAYIKSSASTDDYGLVSCSILKSTNSGSSYTEYMRDENRKHGSGYVLGPAASATLVTTTANTTRIRVTFSESYDATCPWRIGIVTIGCTATQI